METSSLFPMVKKPEKEACSNKLESLEWLPTRSAYASLLVSLDELEQSICNRGPTRLCRAERAPACGASPWGEGSGP